MDSSSERLVDIDPNKQQPTPLLRGYLRLEMIETALMNTTTTRVCRHTASVEYVREPPG